MSCILLCPLALVVIALVAGAYTGILERVYYELQNQLTGQIQLETGTFTGATDLVCSVERVLFPSRQVHSMKANGRMTNWRAQARSL